MRFAYGYRVLGDERYLAAASKAARIHSQHLERNPMANCYIPIPLVLLSRMHTLTTMPSLSAVCSDCMRLQVGDQWLNSARTLTDKMIQLFWDDRNGGFYYTKADAKHLIVRTKKPYDSAIPSGNAVAVKNLLVLGADYADYAEKTLRIFAESMVQSPSSFMFMHFALNDYLTSAENLEPSSAAVVAATATVTAKSDEVFNVVLQLKIGAGWHINANPAGQDYLIPTTVELDANAPIEIVDIAYPKGKSMRFAFSDEPLNIYEKSLTIPLRLKQKLNVTRKNDAPITLKLTYQPCNDTECLFPETLDIPLRFPQ